MKKLIILLLFPLLITNLFSQEKKFHSMINIGSSFSQDISLEIVSHFGITKDFPNLVVASGIEFVKSTSRYNDFWSVLFSAGWITNDMGAFIKFGPTNRPEKPIMLNYGAEFLFPIKTLKYSPIIGVAFTKDSPVQIKIGVAF